MPRSVRTTTTSFAATPGTLVPPTTTSFAATPGTLIPLAGLPDFLAGPPPGPFEGGEGVRGRGAGRGPYLDQVLDVEPAPAQQPDHVAVTEVKLHRLVVRPLEAVHAEEGPQQPLGGRQAILVGQAEHELDGVGQEDQPPSRTEQPRGLGDPDVRVAPDARAVLRDREVERRTGQRDVLGTGVHEREP